MRWLLLLYTAHAWNASFWPSTDTDYDLSSCFDASARDGASSLASLRVEHAAVDGARCGFCGHFRRSGLPRLWRPEYPVWAKRDGYIPVYTVGMVNTRYIPVFMEYSDPSTVSQSHRAPCRSQCGTHRRLSAD